MKKIIRISSVGISSGIIIATLILIILIGYRVEWTGFESKTLWDWMELVLIPIGLFLGARYFAQSQQKNEENRIRSGEQATIVQNYIDRIQELILTHGLRDATPEEPVATIAYTLTKTTLNRLEPENKFSILSILDGTGLIQAYHTGDLYIPLTGVNLSGIGTPTAYVWGSFIGADFSFSNLEGVCFDMSDFRGAELKGVILENSNLMYCNFEGANLEGVFLTGTNMFGSIFSEHTILPNGEKWTKDTDWSIWNVVFTDPYTEKEYKETLKELRYHSKSTKRQNNDKTTIPPPQETRT